MSKDLVLYETAGRVATITLNDPDRRNPVSDPAMIDALVGAIGRVQRDTDISVAILTGAGTAFSSGGDVKAMRDRAGMFGGPPQHVAEGYMYGIQQIPLALYALDVPTIAAVNGPAMGAGCDLAFMCDMRIASTTALFGEVFVSLGLIAGDAGSWFLPRRVPWEVAAEMSFTGRPIRGRGGVSPGPVHEGGRAGDADGRSPGAGRRHRLETTQDDPPGQTPAARRDEDGPAELPRDGCGQPGDVPSQRGPSGGGQRPAGETPGRVFGAVRRRSALRNSNRSRLIVRLCRFICPDCVIVP